jgi:hypothetical protein
VKYTFIDKNKFLRESKFRNLLNIAEGPIELANGWTGDRINYDKSLEVFIEFRSGPEGPPGIVPSSAHQVTMDYIVQKYGIDRKDLESIC